MQLVVVMAVRKAVSAATITFTAFSTIFFFMTITHTGTVPLCVLINGVGVRQLARLTGVSYEIIQRLNEKVGQRTSPDPIAPIF